jgi:hypothetical protein
MKLLRTELLRTELLRTELLGTEVLSVCTARIMRVGKTLMITGLNSPWVIASAEIRRIVRVAALRLLDLGFAPGRHILADLSPKLTTGRGQQVLERDALAP